MARKPIRSLSQQTLRDLGQLLRDSRNPDRSTMPRRRWPAAGGLNRRTGTSVSTGASCACCDPSNCADYTQPTPDSECTESPFGWEVNFGNSITLGLHCFGMDFDELGAIEVEYVSYGVWRSATFNCDGSALIGGCNAADGAECCTGSAVMHWDESDAAWTETSNDCSEGCTSQIPSDNPGVDGDVTVPCTDNTNYDIFISLDGTTWTMTGGNCASHPVPDAGAYPPVGAGDVRHFPCCADPSSLPTGSQYAWFELSIDNTRDADNRSGTTLELIIGGVAAFTYVLPIGKDWCCTCENKMELKCCGPWTFRFIPESVCVRPMTPQDVGLAYVEAPESWACCVTRASHLGFTAAMPRFYEFEIAMDDPTHACCAGNASGLFALEWNSDSGQWESGSMVTCELGTTPTPFAGDCVATDPPGHAPGAGDTSETFARWILFCAGGVLSLVMRVFKLVDTETIGGPCSAYGQVDQVTYTLDASSQNCDDVEGLVFAYSSGGSYCATHPATVTVYPLI